MQITLFDQNKQLCEAFEKEFEPYNNVTVFHGTLEEVPGADAIVAAGNSFGIMDGGLDAAMAFQWPELQENVRERISNDFMGELPVGNAVIVQTGDPDKEFPICIYTPTMRFPRPIASEVVYDAMRAALLAAWRYTDVSFYHLDNDMPAKINSIAIPGLGTRSGGVGAFHGARMMRLGYESIFELDVNYSNWDEVAVFLKSLYGQKP